MPYPQEMHIRSLGGEDALEKTMTTHSSQYSCLENPMDRRAWREIVHRVSRDRHTEHTILLSFTVHITWV